MESYKTIILDMGKYRRELKNNGLWLNYSLQKLLATVLANASIFDHFRFNSPKKILASAHGLYTDFSSILIGALLRSGKTSVCILQPRAATPANGFSLSGGI